MSPALLADTHIPRCARTLPRGLVPHLEEADLVLHAGDLMGVGEFNVRWIREARRVLKPDGTLWAPYIDAL